jgi:putative Mg2+ transporter-C (MgtC) family protein
MASPWGRAGSSSLNSLSRSILSASIGLKPETRQKSAGLRTYTLVGFSSALVMLVSKYGFTNILESGRVVLDPSRIAAQIVSGIGFIGGGLIFVRKDIVRGLTTAATVWLTAAVGMVCGAGLPILAFAVTFGHFVVVFVFPSIERRLPKSRWAPSSLQISYQDGLGVFVRCLRVAPVASSRSVACRSSGILPRKLAPPACSATIFRVPKRPSAAIGFRRPRAS